MCGIAGFLGYRNLSKAIVGKAAEAMAKSMVHRGPDDEGIWSDASDEITLVHRRLAIIDLSSNGRQPMESASKRYCLIFNGEIYNHLDLRARLESVQAAPKWRGHSDTETLLAGIEHWGLEATLRLATGMFAIALWDTKEKTIHLARDRMGEKPLYYGESNGVFLFASELKPMTVHPAFNADINPNAIATLMQYYYIPAPISIYEGIWKLRPGHILSVTSKRGGYTHEETAYWSLTDSVVEGNNNQLQGSENDIIDGLEACLRRAVELQMIADVPVGAFLSGGVDSSITVALMQEACSSPVNTYSMGFEGKGDFIDEVPYARAVARHLRTNHTELYVSDRNARDVIPEIPHIFDEPFADSSQIPTILLSRLTRRDVTVSLSGDGGDELFGGYERYPYAMKLHRTLAPIPPSLRRAMALVNSFLPWNALELLSGHAINKVIGVGGVRGLAFKMAKLNHALAARNVPDFYDAIIVPWLDTSALVPGSNPAGGRGPAHPDFEGKLSFLQHMLALDLNNYLPDDLLVKVDRAAMSVSLETRMPLLDHAVVEYAFRVPDRLKIKGSEKKYLLKQLLYRHVPQNLIDRPKSGFGAPLEIWMKNGLRDWAEELLAPDKLKDKGYFNEQFITQKWNESMAGKRSWLTYLWPVLMFQAWEAGR